MTPKCAPFGTPTALLTALYINSKMAKIMPMTAANHTQQTNSYASHTPLFSKLGYTLKIAKPGMPNPTMKKHGQTSKHTSTAHNAYSVTNFAQPNRPALPATLPSTPKMKSNHLPNIVKLSSISPLLLQPTAYCSLLWPLPSPISTTTFKNSTKRPSPVSTTVKPLT